MLWNKVNKDIMLGLVVSALLAAHFPLVDIYMSVQHQSASSDQGQPSLLVGIGAAQKNAGSKPMDRRKRALSFAVGSLVALLIAVGMFILLVSQK